MSRAILCTVGTSLLTNTDGGRPWAGWRHEQPLPSPDAVTEWLRHAEPHRASAETNTLRALEVSEEDAIVFLHSDTEEGRFCAEMLQRLYESRGCLASCKKIAQLGYGAHVFTRGLKGLVCVVLALVRKAEAKQQEPILCATGGFKAETAFLNLLGALCDIEVVYLHELHRELVRLPRLPLTWNTDFVLKHEAFFQWIDAEPRRSDEVESRLHAAPELRFLVEDDGEGHTMLTTAGDLLFKAARARHSMGPRAVWPQPDPRPPTAKNQVSTTEHHRPAGWEAFVERLARIDCVSCVRYDDAAQRGARVRVLDPDHGAIAVRYERGDRALPLCVETTARGRPQCDLVANYLQTIKG